MENNSEKDLKKIKEIEREYHKEDEYQDKQVEVYRIFANYTKLNNLKQQAQQIADRNKLVGCGRWKDLDGSENPKGFHLYCGGKYSNGKYLCPDCQFKKEMREKWLNGSNN